MGYSKTSRLKSLVNGIPPGFIADASWFKERDIDSKSIYNYVNQGWLERIIRGVYRRPLPKGVESGSLSWEAVLLSLQRLMGYHVHLGGRNALDHAGYAHFIMMGEDQRVDFYGNAPSWLNCLPTKDNIVISKPTLFDDDSIGLVDSDHLVSNKDWAAGIWRWPIKASSPERAILELIAQLQGNSDFEYVELYFQTLISLRPELLMNLLRACRSIKAKRLFFIYADFYQHPWRKELDTNQIDFGRGPRSLVPGGKFHPVYQISLPEYFLDTSYEDDCIF